MKSLIVEFFGYLIPVTIALLVFAQGLRISTDQVQEVLKERGGQVLRSLIATLVVVPAVAVALILALKPVAGVAIGLAILVSGPPAPMMFKTAPGLGKGDAAFMESLHMILAALALVTMPVILSVIAVPLGFNADVDRGAMAWTLARTILLPIGVAIAVRTFSPAFANKAAPILAKIANLGLLVVVVGVLAVAYPALLAMDPWSFLVIAVVAAAALAIGHLAGPPDPDEKTVSAIECAVRHPALALGIGSLNFGAQKAMAVLLPCVLTIIAVAFVYMIWRGKSR